MLRTTHHERLVGIKNRADIRADGLFSAFADDNALSTATWSNASQIGFPTSRTSGSSIRSRSSSATPYRGNSEPKEISRRRKMH
ncbi:hypothetical protein [Pararhodobacter sp. SW119]|uniref:hypothetical protein n=1 Tax=Pararhodobacter sp. SW119 TaxID=2780075 RepID=UPI001ADFD71A|nr:hypothetical protein [Pararhodobacter sp. SW119]